MEKTPSWGILATGYAWHMAVAGGDDVMDQSKKLEIWDAGLVFS